MMMLNWTINRGASFRWSFGPLFAWGSRESTTILTTHHSLVIIMKYMLKNVSHEFHAYPTCHSRVITYVPFYIRYVPFLNICNNIDSTNKICMIRISFDGKFNFEFSQTQIFEI